MCTRHFLVFCFTVFCALSSSCSQEKESPLFDEENVPSQESSLSKDTLVITHWNIGHLSLGKSNNTIINEKDSDIMAEKYHSLLDTIDTDILGICEYNTNFTRSDTRIILFEDYPYYHIGTKYSYNQNAIFSKISTKNSKETHFKVCVQKRYYVETSFYVNKGNVTFVETHLDWDEGSNGAAYRREQMKELAEEFSKRDNVIICGDFNNHKDMSEFDVFKKYGFSLANNGSLLTYPAKKTTSPIDNIVFKGFDLVDVDLISDPTLSDHTMIRCFLKMKSS